MARDSRQTARARRAQVAGLAARLLVDDGMTSANAARAKAARRLGVTDRRDLPTPAEIEVALSEYQRIFGGDAHPRQLRESRQAALAAMRLFERFQPRLVGRVLSGTAHEHMPVTLHVFADTPEEVMLFLLEREMPYRNGEQRVRDAERGVISLPCYRFLAGETEVELVVFPAVGLRRAPLSPVDGRPMERAGRAELERLLSADDPAPGLGGMN